MMKWSQGLRGSRCIASIYSIACRVRSDRASVHAFRARPNCTNLVQVGGSQIQSVHFKARPQRPPQTGLGRRSARPAEPVRLPEKSGRSSAEPRPSDSVQKETFSPLRCHSKGDRLGRRAFRDGRLSARQRRPIGRVRDWQPIQATGPTGRFLAPERPPEQWPDRDEATASLGNEEIWKIDVASPAD
jgi:hypothetical protein